MARKIKIQKRGAQGTRKRNELIPHSLTIFRTDGYGLVPLSAVKELCGLRYGRHHG